MARRGTSTARRYAEAAFQIAQRDENTEVWLAELDRLATAVSDEAVVRSLEDPQIPFETRHDAFKSLFREHAMLPQVDNMIGLLLRRRRLEAIVDIAREFRRLYNLEQGIVEARATSAAKLSDDEVKALSARLEQMTGGRIELTLSVDPALLGGLQVRMGDLLIDGSVRGRLERLRSRLESGALTA